MNAHTKTRKTGQFRINRIIAFLTLLTGIALLVLSAFYTSLVSAVIGLALTFWGSILLYITPTKHVPLGLLTAVAFPNLANIEKLLIDSNLNEKGVYLPPKYLKDFESSLVFIPSHSEKGLPKPEEVDEDKLFSKNPRGLLLTPPGLTLSKLFEKELGTSFTRTDLNYLKGRLAKLLVEDMEIADDAKIETENDIVTIEIKNHVLSEICQDTRKLPRTHASVGCALSSAIACALAKATGEPVTIEKEEQSELEKTTRIQYRIGRK
jgi:hypothetical protein